MCDLSPTPSTSGGPLQRNVESRSVDTSSATEWAFQTCFDRCLMPGSVIIPSELCVSTLSNFLTTGWPKNWGHLFCLCQGGGYAIGTVCLSFCEQDYCKSNPLISLKLGVVIGPINRKNWLTFGGDPFLDTDSGSLFHQSVVRPLSVPWWYIEN